MTRRFDTGDCVRIDIPDKTDPDFEQYHDRRGTIIGTLSDAAGAETGDDRDNVLYRVQFSDGEKMDFRWRDLRPTER